MNRVWVYISILICICLLVIYRPFNKSSYEEQFNFDISRTSKDSRVIRSSGKFALEPNSTYYFDMPEDMSYLLHGKPRDLVSLHLPEEVQDGDTIILIDKNNRFGWGNLSYDYRIILGDNQMRGDLLQKSQSGQSDLSSLNLFPYRGGHVIFVWNEKDSVWESNGYKGNIENMWNGWYKLEYKGFLPSLPPGVVRLQCIPRI